MIIIAVVIGFMIAIQFQTVKKPVIRDTRDMWELREDLLKEKELQAKLIREIRSNEEKLAKYETERKQSREQALRETLEELKKEAGLTEVTGHGIILTIEPIFDQLPLGAPPVTISPEIFKRLINELNMYNAKYISVQEQRIINTTVIRDINGETKIDGYSLNNLPIEIKVIVENHQIAKKLYNRMQVSKSVEDLFIDNLQVNISNPQTNITIPAYQETIRIRDMEPVKHDKGGNS
ncbi:DUF881 domain-containing protein [Bacillus aquiflavi]|uniref:DUF881 domain-containing protein n=2 Tax=Bacillus aquiflavi TaxID=2672567 RepID=A0A6B3VY46_9BACI|nr:DUF881 domain-containing protein [Bacillus aquiflavi]NEY81862.1 DUF881 domain-containing protein [Bacillus aquiflavi]UAC49984.1 DUF881 domain-containing protein [Bacillus aquiflavi]